MCPVEAKEDTKYVIKAISQEEVNSQIDLPNIKKLSAYKTIEELEIDKTQSFRVSNKNENYRVLSYTAKGKYETAVFSCGLIIQNLNVGTQNLIELMGADEKRPWTCDSIVALWFGDVDGDNKLDVLSIVRGTAPSGTDFLMAVVIKWDSTLNKFVVDEPSTARLKKAGTKSIQGAIKILKNSGR